MTRKNADSGIKGFFIGAKTIKHINKELRYWAGVDLTNEQIANILSDDLELAHDCEIGFDTAERDQFMSRLAKFVGCADWPVNGDDWATQAKFELEFPKGCTQKGIKLLDERWGLSEYSKA